DVYCRDGKFYLVPVYLKDVADGVLPLRACKGATLEAQWPVMDGNYEFLFSLTKNCYVLTEKKGFVKEGFYKKTDRANAVIEITAAEDKQIAVKVGVLQLDRFEKYLVDRMGRRIRVTHEPDPRKR
ncbi:MAG: hypothetical protein IIV56_07400, partial [Mailhella sp.]|nr:hypothetical protein [Mailhella sp.]